MFSRKKTLRSAHGRTLGLFLSEGAGFGLWKNIGSFEREMAIYFELARSNWKIRVFSYEKNDLNHKLPENVSVSAIPFGFLNHRFLLFRQLLSPTCLWFAGRKCDLLITNQAHNGGWIAVLAGKFWGAKTVARCGYVYGEYIETEGMRGPRYSVRRWQEKWTMRHADKCMVPTKDLIDWVSKNYSVKSSDICLMPNFVNTDLFKPDNLKSKDFDIVCVGRLSNEKRHWMILEAAKCLPMKRVLFIGSGPLKKDLLNRALQAGIDLKIIESVPNSSLPDFINSSKYFILATTREGHPKSLIEAMSCGCVCIGADRPGIKNMIQHNVTGLLFNSTPEGLQEALGAISANPDLSNRFPENARNFILENMSFSKISSDYKNILSNL